MRNTNHWRLQLQDKSTGGYLQKAFFNPSAYRGAWSFFVVTYDGSGVVTGINSYFNGATTSMVDESSGTYVAMENTGSQLVMARQAGEYGNGYIALPFIANTAWSAKQVANFYNLTKGLFWPRG